MVSQDFEALSRSRIKRARQLASAHAEAREVLDFYADVLSFQIDILAVARDRAGLVALRSRLVDFVLEKGSNRLRQEARQLDDATLRAALEDYWQRRDTSSLGSFFPRVLLEVYAQQATDLSPAIRADNLCPHCAQRPLAGVLRPAGEGNALTLLCSLCLREWSFPRLTCPACGERDEKKLPGYSAAEFDHVKIEACESCGSYLKHIDLSRQPRALAPVDELAAISLDVWAKNEGFEKIHANLAGI